MKLQQLSIIFSLCLPQQQVLGAVQPNQPAQPDDPLCVACKADNVQLVTSLVADGVLDKKTDIECCFKTIYTSLLMANTFRVVLTCPKVFDRLLDKIRPFSLESVANILRIDSGEPALYDLGKLDDMVLWEAFNNYGWEVYTALRIQDPFTGEDEKCKEFFFAVPHLIGKRAAGIKIYDFVHKNLRNLLTLAHPYTMQRACLATVQMTGDKEMEKAYLKQSQGWSGKQHLEFIEEFARHQGNPRKFLSIREKRGIRKWFR
jgi:hypothetical protein